jgi:1,4-dihydroxy-2-naphthoate octaprenyltransferase
MARLLAFAQLTRPVFLAGGAVLYALGAALADGPIDRGRYAVGQAMVTAIQLSAHYANEFFDLDADRLVAERRTWFSGGSGALAGGNLPPAVALRAARVTSLISMVAVAAAATFSPGLALIGAAALAGAWAYSAPPLRLVSTAAGVTVASMVVAVLTPLAGALTVGSATVDETAAILASLFVLHHAMLLAFERPDRESDARAGKRTLSVRIGQARATVLHGALVLSAFAVLASAAGVGVLTWKQVAWALALVPLALWQVVAFSRAGDFVVTFGAVVLFVSMVGALLAGAV